MFKASLTYKRTISFATALVVSLASISPAFAQTVTQSEQKRAAQDTSIMKSAGYNVKVDYQNKITRVFDKTTNIPVMEIPFADEASLRKYDPKNIEHRLLSDMGKVWNGQKAAFTHSLTNLAPESMMFFMSMGLVIAGQLVLDYSMNPVAMDQHVTHSFSPMGIIGFQLFMYSQGAASNVLAMYMKNPKYHAFIPYLGMTVGATVQGLATQIASDPNVKACAMTWMGKKVTDKDLQRGVDKDPCSKAYDYLVIHKKIWEMAPNITSMLISSAVAAGLEKGGTAALTSKVVAGNVLRWTGVDIVTWLVPGSIQVKGLRMFLTKGLKLAAFVALDQLFMRSVTYAWKNVFDGHELYSVTEELETAINTQKKSKWTSSDAELQEKVKTFKEKLSAWRMANLADVYEANQNWQSALYQLTQGYRATENFYGDFVSQVRQTRFEGSSNLARMAPLNGVTPDGMKKGADDSYHTDPKFIETRQAYTVTDVASAATVLLNSPDYKSLMAPEKKKFESIINALGDKDLNKVGAALTELNSEMARSAQNITVSRYYQVLNQLRAMLGNPEPMMQLGRSWATTYVTSPSSYEKVKDTNYYRRVGLFGTPKISDYMIMQMVCGPDIEKGDASVRSSAGYPAVFLPPTIANSQDEFYECEGIAEGAKENRIYDWKVKSQGGNYNGWVDYLLAQTRPSIIGTKESSGFETWWKNNSYAQMKTAFDKFGVEYDKIVVKLVRGLYKPGKIAINAGPAYNGTMNSIFQEERAYLSILNELMAPSASYKMNFENNMNQAPTNPLLKEVEAEFAKLNGLLKQIKVVSIDGRERIQSSLQNSQLEEQANKIQEVLNKLAITLGVNSAALSKTAEKDPFAALEEEESGKPTAAVATQKFKLSKSQNNLAVAVLEALQGLTTEMKMYGSIANAVSWDKINNLASVNEDMKKFNNMVQKQLSEMRSIANPTR
ncbi:hypothetical protein B9G69_007460 [Bdellovibrio sp. SKB1291214]|uniref:hypothetical protein n=1 Tax=Bdellovibrio sp. SKB1291214 TaxID=1732569 RepID=UPI000B51D231|nr:hypothetical protein [Bdellovibrio sp. SKB1291214]UYL10416.1 hypothetical protein B9G69_007460 [Bdellovibrio sp. SKB1291214]